jgi:hypothetical protein
MAADPPILYDERERLGTVAIPVSAVKRARGETAQEAQLQ